MVVKEKRCTPDFSQTANATDPAGERILEVIIDKVKNKDARETSIAWQTTFRLNALKRV